MSINISFSRHSLIFFMNKSVYKKDFLSVSDLSAKEIWEVFKLAKKLKIEFKKSGKNKKLLENKQMVLIFEKASLRTKLSFDMGFDQLGGHSVYFGPSEIGLGKRESVSDIAKVSSSMSDLIVARVNSHQSLVELAENSTVPVINALSDYEHPAQALTDLFTIWEVKGNISGLKIAFVGDGNNNTTHSLCLASVMLGADFRCASPSEFSMDRGIVKKAQKLGLVAETTNPRDAVKKADVVYTDTWVSMGSETEKRKRLKVFKKYQVDTELMKFAKNGAIFMHDLPAYRGNEVTADVIDGAQSVVFQQAENRMHLQKALMVWLLKYKN
jgi:ornithine carbamoyltransferase